MDLLITGTDGFIGGYLKDYFISYGHNVVGTVFDREPIGNEVKLDITKTISFQNLPQTRFDAIIHSIGIVDQTAPKKLLFAVNAEGTNNLLSWAKDIDFNHLLYLSSISVYGRRAMGQNRTETKTKRYEGRFSIAYGRSKAKAEKYIEESGLNYTILRLPAVLGAKDTFLSPSIISALKADKFYFAGKKDHLVSTLYIKNLGSILKKILDIGPLNDAFNCTDYHVSWKEFVGEFAKNLDVPLVIKRKSMLSILTHLGDKNYIYMMVNSYFGAHFPSDKLKQLIDFELSFPWQDGVKEAVNNYFTNLTK